MKRGSTHESGKPSLPLAGIRVLVGRARHQAGALSGALRKLGATVLEIPFIEIRKPRSFRPLDSALKSLSTYDWLILTSVNGVEAMWERMERVGGAGPLHQGKKKGTSREKEKRREGQEFTRASRSAFETALAADGRRIRIAAIGPATRKAIEQRGGKVDVVPKEYVAESVVCSLRNKVSGKRVLLVRAKVARDVIPRELRKAGAHVDVVEAYETVVPQSSRRRLRAALKTPGQRPQVVTFTSSSTARNFVALLASGTRGRGRPRHTLTDGILMASIGPVTSATLRELGFDVHIAAKVFTIPGLVQAVVKAFAARA